MATDQQHAYMSTAAAAAAAHLLSMFPMLLASVALTVSLKATSEKLPSRPNTICSAAQYQGERVNARTLQSAAVTRI
jgi:uncharacterized BrkB/YihY/UPF0761 family membrane protein